MFENIGYVKIPEHHLYNTQKTERSDEVSPYLMIVCVQVPVRKLLFFVVDTRLCLLHSRAGEIVTLCAIFVLLSSATVSGYMVVGDDFR